MKRLMPTVIFSITSIFLIAVCPCSSENVEGTRVGKVWFDENGVRHEDGEGGSSSGGSSYDGPSYAEIQAAERAREAAIEAERKRKEAVQAIKEREAADAKRKIEWNESKKKVADAMKGATPGGMALKTGYGPTVRIGPYEETPAVVIGSEQQAASTEDSENLKRAMWLYKKAAQAADPEEANFLMQQGDEAAQGHALRVEVPSGEITSEPPVTKERLERFEKIKAHRENSMKERDDITNEMTKLGEERRGIKKEVEDIAARLDAMGIRSKEQSATAIPGKESAQTAEPVEKQVVDLVAVLKDAQKNEPDKFKEADGDDLLKKMMAVKKRVDETASEVTELVDRRQRADKELALSDKEMENFKNGK
ncbi:MAG: hypothetical protein PHS37_01780 [Candidatus Omnitrophica bacterium]|nr:hypothetical protein [Candidatus Omnitrophota bacterium]